MPFDPRTIVKKIDRAIFWQKFRLQLQTEEIVRPSGSPDLQGSDFKVAADRLYETSIAPKRLYVDKLFLGTYNKPKREKIPNDKKKFLCQ
jgi:hypothetical protein